MRGVKHVKVQVQSMDVGIAICREKLQFHGVIKPKDELQGV